MAVSTCPSAAELESLINGALPAGEEAGATEHISTCSRCQSRLDEISLATETMASGEFQVASGERLVNVAIEDLVGKAAAAGPPKDSSYWKAITGLSADYQIRSTPDADRTAVDRTAETSAAMSPVQDVVPDRADDVKRADDVQRDIEPVRTPESTNPTMELPSAALPFLQKSDDPAYLGRLHHFQISRIIGRGGMGIVLEAFDTHLQRTVAIKVLNPEYSKNDVARKRFCREGRAAAAINHEHVVAMHQVAKEDEGKVAFLVMQYIEGETLETRMKSNQPLPAAEAARIGMQIAAGLSAAHEREMVHRDIKPANILIEKGTERVKLTDFGLARATDDVRLTRTGMVTGTPLYMSPEQATGATADERSDLFSLGAVLYEMLTGSSPFEAPSIVGVMKRIMDETPRSPSKLDPKIPESLSELTMALLEKSPDKRPESAAFVAEMLARILSSYGPISPLHVPAVGSNSTRVRSTGAHRLVSRNALRAAWAAGILGLASLLLAGVFIATGSFVDQEEAVAGPSFPSTVLAGNPGTVWAADFDPSGKKIAAAIENGSVRLWDIEAKKVLRSFEAHQGIVWMIKYHPTRPMVATCGSDGAVKLWDSQSLELRQQWDAEGTVRKIAFAPDGRRIVAGDQSGVIHIWDIDSGFPLAEVSQPGAILGVDWSPDGRLIATVGSDQTVRVWDAESVEIRQTFTGHAGPIYNVAFAPTGSRLATVGWGETVHIWDVATGLEERQLVGGKGDNWSVAFCADGSHAVIAAQDGTGRIFNLDDGTLVATLTGHEGAVHNVTLNAAEHRAATSSRDGTIRIWDLSSLQH